MTSHRYDSPEQERIAKEVLDKHKDVFSQLTNASPRHADYAWIDMLPADDRQLVDSLYLWAAITHQDGDNTLAEDLRKAAERIGDLWHWMEFGRPKQQSEPIK